MGKVMTEDIVNEICKVCIEALGCTDTFSIFEGKVRYIHDEENGFCPWGEPVLVGDLDLSIEVERFLSDINWFKDDMGLVFFIRDDDIIEMHFCHDSWDGFQPELSFTFKKTFDDDLFD
jgi:hypothetical protein